jgi:hypothetical protein
VLLPLREPHHRVKRADPGGSAWRRGGRDGAGGRGKVGYCRGLARSPEIGEEEAAAGGA